MIQISNTLKREFIRANQQPKDKNDLFEILIDIIDESDKVTDINLLNDDLHIRENVQTTGLGYGLALPHVASNGINDIALSCVVCPDGVDYDAIDQEPVYIAFLIAQPLEGKTRDYLHILASLSRLFRGTGLLEEILKCKNANEVFDMIMAKATERGY